MQLAVLQCSLLQGMQMITGQLQLLSIHSVLGMLVSARLLQPLQALARNALQ
jgi:hypothetical protein